MIGADQLLQLARVEQDRSAVGADLDLQALEHAHLHRAAALAAAVEVQVFERLALGGRRSWARLIYSTPQEFLRNYPEHHRFVEAKRELDPANLFSNAFSDRICDAAAPAGD